jgi:hypothetical protein
LVAIEHSPLVGIRETQDILDRQIELAKAAKAPVAVVASLEARRAASGITDEDLKRVRLATVANDPTFKADAEARAYLDLLMGTELSRPGRPLEELRRAADTSSLPPTHPVRRAANLRLSEYEFGKERADRRNRIKNAAVGLNPCDAAQIRPLSEISDRAYPELTRRWGFAGWTFVQIDIGADSKPYKVLSTVAYPPFVFTPTAVRAVYGLRFGISGALASNDGCTGYDTSVRFHLE